PQVFTINENVYSQLSREVDSYRNRLLFDFETNEVRRVEIQGPQGELRLEKKGEEWVKMGDPEAKVNASAVDVFLIGIHALRIQQYLTDQPGRFADYGLPNPWMQVKITFGSENREETVLLGLKNKRFYAARQGEPSVYELNATEQESVETKLKDITA
ncbi:MAG: DUF4340 domain-containing protein, partial [Acidobacteria bacterium]|nr:DUF4340 domain-containing protein [Acidobacteriota bacterium]